MPKTQSAEKPGLFEMNIPMRPAKNKPAETVKTSAFLFSVPCKIHLPSLVKFKNTVITGFINQELSAATKSRYTIGVV